MTFEEFSRLVRHKFGDDLSRASPEAMNDFIAAFQQTRLDKITSANPLSLDASDGTVEGIVREFFANALTVSSDEAAIALWLSGAQLAFGGLEDVEKL